MTREALVYIRRNYISETVIKHRDRAERPGWRTSQEREPIEVRISPDELVILSYPGPDRSIRLADLKRGKAVARRYRNRRIGEILKELGLTEGRSTGIPKILRAMKANGSPMPAFEFNEDHSYFMTRLRAHPAVPRATPPTQSPTQSTDPVERLLRALEDRELSAMSLRQAAGIKHRPTFRANYLHPALEDRLIEYTLPEKPNSRLQRYRLTDKGRAWLATRQEEQQS